MSKKNTPTKKESIKENKKESGFKTYFKELGEAISKGDWSVKLSMLFMGAGYTAHKQIIKGILLTLFEALSIVLFVSFAIPSLKDFGTLGTVKFEKIIDPATLQTTVNDYDNSFTILLGSIVSLFFVVVFILFWIANIKAVYRLQLIDQLPESINKPHINNFWEDIKTLVNDKFHITLLFLPTVGVILMNIIPILVLIAIAFTNYDQNHMPPNALFTWVGLANFKSLFTNTVTSSFSYAFGKILGWTFLWAVLATVTTFFLGILLAMLINVKGVKFKKMWRTLFIVAIAVPQFVTLLLVRYFFDDSGIVNSVLGNLGIVDVLKNIGLVNEHLNYIPFLSSEHWAKFMIIMINIWVGVPYQMLIATGVLMNVPTDQIEAAKIDGATNFQAFVHITMPYVLFIQGPALITDFVKNINNFNVIYLLTNNSYITPDQAMANANGKEVDLLVTWLFRLTNEYYNYKMASVIGIIVFIICAVFTLTVFRKLTSGDREEQFQ